MITAQLGDNALEVALSDGCFDLSDNFITVNKEEAAVPINGGMVSLLGGDTIAYTCPGDTLADLLFFESTGATGPEFTYVVTDEAGIILGLPPADSLDFEEAGIGVCLVWGLSFSGSLTAQVGDDATTTPLSDDEFDLSDNFIVVNRDVPNGGLISTTDGVVDTTIMVLDGIPDVIQFISDSTSNSKFIYVVTDTSGIILALTEADSLDFDSSGVGVCLVWGLSYTGEITAQVGDNALEVALSDGCFDLSDNSLRIDRIDMIPKIAPNLPISEVHLFPNPGRQKLSINFKSLLKESGRARISILDNFGRVVIDGLHPSNLGENRVDLNVSELDPGIYTIRVLEGKKVRTQKFVKVD